MPETQLPKPETLNAYASALYHALSEDPFYVAMEKQLSANPREAMTRYYAYSLAEAFPFRGVCLTDTAPVGASIWTFPAKANDQARAERTGFFRSEMGTGCLHVYQDIVGFMAQARASLVRPDDWYLSILGIHPAHQGNGLGKSLVDPMLAKADLAGVATYLETFTPRNMRFYERLGFRTVGRIEEPTTQSPYWVMRRDAVAPKETRSR